MTLTPERAAAVARTERELADRFEHYRLDEPQEKAAALVRWLQSQGWRVHPELARDAVPSPRPASRAVARAALVEARAAVEAAKRARLEREGTEVTA